MLRSSVDLLENVIELLEIHLQQNGASVHYVRPVHDWLDV